MSTPENPPAFPHQNLFADLPHDDAVRSQIRNSEGMTLRDYFAAKAMQGILTQQDIGQAGMAVHHDGGGLHLHAADKAARIAYIVADAMIAARNRAGEEGR